MSTNNTLQSIEIDQAVVTGIRRTINRFRENPFYYFTESDIHASLVKDILEGHSDKFYLKLNGGLRLSLVHLEYPTNFSYSRKEALSDEITETSENKKQRGNFDLVVLKESKYNQIVEESAQENQSNNKKETLISFLRSIISKDITHNEDLHLKMNDPIGELIDYAIEVKFFHFNNASQEMFDQVRIDNFKLAKTIENKARIKPINLIFCYYWNDSKKKNQEWVDKMKLFREKLKDGKIVSGGSPISDIPANVLNIFIEVNIGQSSGKNTLKPACYYKGSSDVCPEWVQFLISGYERVEMS